MRVVKTESADARRRVFAAYAERDYAGAMRLAEQAATDFPDRADQTTYWIACLHALLGDGERALATLEGGRATGLWWSPELLDGDPDLASVRDDQRFRAIVAASTDANASVTARLPLEPLVVPAREPAECGLVLLHGRNETAEDILAQWRASRRAMLIGPRSSQPFGMRAVCWDDALRAEEDVIRGVREALTPPNAAGLPLLIGGFSQGAGLAVVLAARRRLPAVIGFIGVAPSSGWALDLLGSPSIDGVGLRGHLIIGDEDPRREDGARLAQQLRVGGAEVRVEVVEGLGHDYPDDFKDRLDGILSWVLQNGRLHPPYNRPARRW